MEEIKNNIKKLSTFYNNIETKINYLIINEVEADNLFTEIEIGTRKILKNIFGDQKYIPDEDIKAENVTNQVYGLVKDLIDYSDGYYDGVLFSYWSHKGQPISAIYSNGEIGRNRDDIFFPIDFFSNYGIKIGKNYLKIITKDNVDKDLSYKNNIIELPILKDYKNFKSIKFKELIKLIYILREHNTSSIDYRKFSKSENWNIFKKFNNIFNEALNDAKQKNESIINRWKTYLSKIFKESFEFDSIFKLITSYQYYDIPYDMHFFLPSLDDKREKLTSCIAISIKQNKDIAKFRNSLIDLAESFSTIAYLEKKIWQKAGEFLPLKITWEQEYKKYYERYKILGKMGENISHAICNDYLKIDEDLFSNNNNNKIFPHLITCRIKEFDSFYNKIIERANGYDDDFPSTYEYNLYYKENLTGKLNSDKKKKYQIKYKEKIKNPNNKNVKYIFENIKDLAGVRIICKYYDDVEEICKRFKKIQESDIKKFGDIKEFKIRLGEAKETLFYRSVHFTYELGDKRKDIIEFKNLFGLKFEVQIRTTLAQGWSDVTHDIYYKPGLPKDLADEFRKIIKDKLDEEAIFLKRSDEVFVDLKKRHNEYKSIG
jgi:putative GTP pyrophosphokinase